MSTSFTINIFMLYVTSFFQQFYPNAVRISFEDLTFIHNANSVAVDFYDGNVNQYVDTINQLLPNTKKLHLYLGEPTDCRQYVNFLNTFDLPNVHFYSDCVLNFKLAHATFTPTVNWFIDPFNYYTKYDWAKNLISQLDFSLDKPFYFDILLGQKKLHRDIVNNMAQSSHYKNLFVYSYFKKNITNGIFWDSNINPSSHTLTSEHFYINSEDCRLSAMLPIDIYNQCYYSIVCETTAYNSYNQYTEKVAKPIIAKRPFIAFAGQYYLKNLKSLGFKTFDSIIDESYDLEPNQNLRFKKAWAQVEFLCRLKPKDVFTQFNTVLEHNQQHFLNTDWALPIKNLF